MASAPWGISILRRSNAFGFCWRGFELTSSENRKLEETLVSAFQISGRDEDGWRKPIGECGWPLV
jgi:hypothetical protein